MHGTFPVSLKDLPLSIAPNPSSASASALSSDTPLVTAEGVVLKASRDILNDLPTHSMGVQKLSLKVEERLGIQSPYLQQIKLKWGGLLKYLEAQSTVFLVDRSFKTPLVTLVSPISTTASVPVKKLYSAPSPISVSGTSYSLGNGTSSISTSSSQVKASASFALASASASASVATTKTNVIWCFFVK